MQASLQRFVDNSISKTCNLPSTATTADVERVYMLGWKLGCKGLTVYISGSREEEVLETKSKKEEVSASKGEAGKSDYLDQSNLSQNVQKEVLGKKSGK